MAEDTQSASIKASVVETTEETFKPGAAVPITADLTPEEAALAPITETQATQIFAELEPLDQEASTFYSQDWLDFYKNYIPSPGITYKALPEYSAAKHELIINCETTGALPWESRLLCIGAMDPNELEPQTLTFYQETEEATITEFVEWLNGTTYDTLVSFNVGFDYRFLYVLMQRYRLLCPIWPEMKLVDMMTQQKQVKQAFVPGYNKEGKLEQWATYLLGTQPYAEQAQVYKWLKEGNIEEIVNFNADKIVKTYFLFTLGKLVAGTLQGTTQESGTSQVAAEIEKGSQYPSAGTLDNEITVQCPYCKQSQVMPKSAKVVNCFVCGQPIASPLL